MTIIFRVFDVDFRLRTFDPLYNGWRGMTVNVNIHTHVTFFVWIISNSYYHCFMVNNLVTLNWKIWDISPDNFNFYDLEQIDSYVLWYHLISREFSKTLEWRFWRGLAFAYFQFNFGKKNLYNARSRLMLAWWPIYASISREIR